MTMTTYEDARWSPRSVREHTRLRRAEEVPVMDGDDDILWITSQGGLDPLDLSHRDGALKLSCPECRAWALYRMGRGERFVEFSHEDACSIGGHRRRSRRTTRAESATVQ
jgi:hypothetical protein